MRGGGGRDKATDLTCLFLCCMYWGCGCWVGRTRASARCTVAVVCAVRWGVFPQGWGGSRARPQQKNQGCCCLLTHHRQVLLLAWWGSTKTPTHIHTSFGMYTHPPLPPYRRHRQRRGAPRTPNKEEGTLEEREERSGGSSLPPPTPTTTQHAATQALLLASPAAGPRRHGSLPLAATAAFVSRTAR